MRKSIFATALLLASGSVAHADPLYIYSGSITITGSPSFDSSFLTGPIFEVTSQTTVGATGLVAGSPTNSVTLDVGTGGSFFVTSSVNGSVVGTSNFTLAQYDTPGTYTVNGANSQTDVLTVAAVPAVAPEPSSIALLGTGLLGLAGIIRRRPV